MAPPKGKKLCVKSIKTAEREDSGLESGNISDTDRFSDDEESGARRLDEDIVIPGPQPVIRADDATGRPRLIISHIVNENFKSYHGRVVIGPFNTSFSCIVGPNGSGKSNVIDSMLFVFGSRANRIRSANLSALIHRSQRAPNLQQCSVEVHFLLIKDTNVEGEYEEVPNSRFIITRTAFADNSSFYRLDDKKVRFKEIAVKLRAYGIDLIYNRFLILQGQVEKISLMKPKRQSENEPGMLEYIEDIIGTTRYEEPLQKLTTKISLLETERNLQRNEVRRVEEEMRILEQPMKVAVDFLKTQNKIAILRNKKYQFQINEINQNSEEAKNKHEELERDLKTTEERISELTQQRSSMEKAVKELNLKINTVNKKFDSCNTSKQKIERLFANLENEESTLQNEERNMNTENEKANADLQKETKSIEDKQTKISDNENNLTKLAEDIEKREVELKTLKENVVKGIKAFDDQKGRYLKRKDDEKEKLHLFEKELNAAKRALNDMQKDYQQASERLGNLQNQYDRNKKETETKKGKLDEFVTEQSEKKSNIERAADITVLANKEEQLYDEVKKLELEFAEQEKRHFEMESQSEVLKFIMGLKERGVFPGIYGRLGSLGAIDLKYDIAISSACSKLDAIVVDSDDTSNGCVQELKRSKVGQAHFIILNKLQNFTANMSNKPTTPQNVPRLFDLVKVSNERFRPAFYHALRETLVANNLDQASDIAYRGSQRYRVVTLRGEVIEAVGIMQGGGSGPPSRGKMGQKVVTDTIVNTTEIKEKLKRLSEEYTTIRSSRIQQEKMIASHTDRLKVLEAQISKLSMDIEALANDNTKLEQELTSTKKLVDDLKPDPSQLEEQSNKIKEIQKNVDKVKADIKSYDEKIADVDEKINKTRDAQLKEPQDNLNKLKKKEKDMLTNNDKLRNEIEKHKMKIKELKRLIEHREQKLVENSRRLQKIATNKNSMQEDLTQVQERFNSLQSELEELKSVFETKQEELNSGNAEYNTLMTEKLTKQKEKDEAMKQLRELLRHLPTLEENLRKLKLNEIPNFDDDAETAHNSEEETLVTYTAEQLAEFNANALQNLVDKEKVYLDSLSPNLNAVNDYKQKRDKYKEAGEKYKKISEKRQQYINWKTETYQSRISEFQAGFSIIARKVKQLYQMLTIGGNADLEMKDSMNPFSEGIELSVRPVGKSWKTMDKLSGGEKTMASLTLVFALHDYRPTPLYFMDEIDAALDETNSCIIGHYIKRKTKMAQFIVISLRISMFETATRLVGIFKVDDFTRSVTVTPEYIQKKMEQLNHGRSEDRDAANVEM